MSSQKSQRNQRKKQNKQRQRNTLTPMVRKLITLAQRSTGSSERSAALEMDLAQAIDKAVENGADGQILHAFRVLVEDGQEEAAEMFHFWAEEAANSISVFLTQDDGTPDGAIIPGSAELFFVPVLMLVSEEVEIPLSMNETTAASDQVAKSFRRHGLIGQEPSIILSSWLYALEDLPRKLSKQRTWLRRIFQSAPIAGGNQDMPVPACEPKKPGGAVLLLRFLSFVTVSGIGDEDAGPLIAGDLEVINEDDANAPQLSAQLSAWSDGVTELLEDAMEDVEVMAVGTPLHLGDAMDEGVFLHNMGQLTLIVELFAEEIAEPIAALRATIGAYTTENDLQIRVGFEWGNRYTGYIWAANAPDLDEDIGVIQKELERLGLVDILVEKTIFVQSECPKCGEPYFPLRGRQAHQSKREDPALVLDESPRTLH